MELISVNKVPVDKLTPPDRPFETQPVQLYYPPLARPETWPSAPEVFKRTLTIADHAIKHLAASDLAKREAGMKGVTKFVASS